MSQSASNNSWSWLRECFVTLSSWNTYFHMLTSSVTWFWRCVGHWGSISWIHLVSLTNKWHDRTFNCTLIEMIPMVAADSSIYIWIGITTRHLFFVVIVFSFIMWLAKLLLLGTSSNSLRFNSTSNSISVPDTLCHGLVSHLTNAWDLAGTCIKEAL